MDPPAIKRGRRVMDRRLTRSPGRSERDERRALVGLTPRPARAGPGQWLRYANQRRICGETFVFVLVWVLANHPPTCEAKGMLARLPQPLDQVWKVQCP